MGIFKLGLSFSGFAIPLIYEICMAIDAIIYEVADRALRAFFEMAKLSADVQAYSTEIGWILQRVMILAGVYALFRIAIMLINYIIDPNKVKDVSKNGTTIVKNIIIAVILLIVSPFVFTLLGRFQGMVIDQNVIPKIVYGPDQFSDSVNENLIKSQSARFVNNVFLLFFVPDGINCDSDTTSYYCKDYNAVKEAKTRGSGFAGVSNLVGYASSKYFTYTPFISGIVGMMLVYYFAVFAIELGKRIIKLVVLQVISPVPIIMSIDPSQKDRVSKFVKAYSGVYLQVFIRIITMYLAFVILSLITDSNFGTDAVQTGMLLAQPSWFVKILLYIGVFQAAKELPKLIEDAIGVKMGEVPGQSFGRVLGGILGGTAGLAGGAVVGGLAGGVGGAIVGAGSGMVSGAIGVAASKNVGAGIKSAFSSIGNQYGTGRRVAASGGLLNYARGSFDNLTGRNIRLDNRYNDAKDKLDKLDTFEKAVLDDYSKAIDPSTGAKFGTMDDNFDVITARRQYDEFVDKYNEGLISGGTPLINPATGAAYTSVDASAEMSRLRTNIKTKEDAYKKDALDWFATHKMGYDPKKYGSLDASQRAHHDFERASKQKLTVPTGSDLKTEFDTIHKSAKADVKRLEAETQTDRAKNARAASKSGK